MFLLGWKGLRRHEGEVGRNGAQQDQPEIMASREQDVGEQRRYRESESTAPRTGHAGVSSKRIYAPNQIELLRCRAACQMRDALGVLLVTAAS